MAQQNPHIPKYIKDAPWYSDKQPDEQNDDYLAHHRSGVESRPNNEARVGGGIDDALIVNDDVGDFKVEFKRRRKKGGCTNCGAMDHVKKDCLERPGRSVKKGKEGGNVGVKVGVRNDNVDYDGKRDRWFGYDASEYVEQAKKWQEKKDEEDKLKTDERQWDTDEEIELKELGLWDEDLKEDVKKAEGEKIVRLREDRAVYLEDIRNDNINYDPKSRILKDDSRGSNDENGRYVRHLTGEAAEFERTKKFAWDEKKRGLGNDNFVANPTLADRKIKELSEAEKAKKEKLKKSLLDVYGSGSGSVTGDGEGAEDNDETDDVVRSSYIEDVYPGNHTSVWGSYYKDGKWGYRCCRSLDRGSVCK